MLVGLYKKHLFKVWGWGAKWGCKVGVWMCELWGCKGWVAQIWTCLLEAHDIAHLYDNHAYVAITWCMCGDYVAMTSLWEIGSVETTLPYN